MSEEYDNSALKASLVREFCDNGDFDDDVPLTKNCWGRFGEFELVGNGSVTNSDVSSKLQCGKFYGFFGCVHTEWHDKTTLDGVNHKGMAYVTKRFHYCNNPRCPVCYRHGWAVREARNIEERIGECSKKFGQEYHIVGSVPVKDYGLSYERLRVKMVKIFASRGVHGGVMIFHPFRYRRNKGWYLGIHFHCIGFITGGYSRCKNCAKRKKFGYVGRGVCDGCDGFEAKTRRLNEKDGYIVEVMLGKMVDGRRVGLEERLSVFGTAWYQLHHAGLNPSKVRFHVATWFGTCSYRKLKLPKRKKSDLMGEGVARCPICGNELVRLRYLGFDLKAILSRFWIKEFEEPAFDVSGNPIWVEKGSESYEEEK